jgi:TetR/AcrR family transcriptional regulator, mexJK operon transcriptional repressor
VESEPTAASRAAGGSAAMDPREARSRTALVEAATAQFLEHGYLASNLDDIAEQAEVSKRTIYNLYGGKEDLFREILTEALDTAERFSRSVVTDLSDTDAEDVEGELRDAGLRLARAVLGGRIVPLRRLLIGEAARFPDLARDYYDRAPGRVMAALARMLQRFDERGLLRVDDPGIAAEHFAFLVMGAPLDRALFDASGQPPPSDEIASRARAGVDAFLRAYTPTR